MSVAFPLLYFYCLYVLIVRHFLLRIVRCIWKEARECLRCHSERRNLKIEIMFLRWIFKLFFFILTTHLRESIINACLTSPHLCRIWTSCIFNICIIWLPDLWTSLLSWRLVLNLWVYSQPIHRVLLCISWIHITRLPYSWRCHRLHWCLP